jgi:hypothetical protein
MKSEVCRVCGESFASTRKRTQCLRCRDVETVHSIKDRHYARRRCSLSGSLRRDLLNLITFLDNETSDPWEYES